LRDRVVGPSGNRREAPLLMPVWQTTLQHKVASLNPIGETTHGMIPRALRPALRAVRHVPDRVLHRTRRTSLIGRLAEKWPREIGFVCYGNICRSPYAEAAAARAFNALGPVGPRVWSAGLFGPGRGSPGAAILAARERGIELSRHSSQQLTSRHLAADWIFVMESYQASSVIRLLGGGTIALLGDLDPEPIDTRAISDPIDKSLDVFRTCYQRIDRCVEILARALSDRSAGRGN
jgi:protein-tyrosine phosphatase